MTVKIEEKPSQQVLTTFALGPYPQSAPKAWKELNDWLSQNAPTLDGQRIGFGMDNPLMTPHHLLRYIAGITIKDVTENTGKDQIYPLTLPGGKFAKHTVTGPYKQIPDAINHVMNEWMQKSEFQFDITRPILEHYVNDPNKVPEAEYQTDILVPVMAKDA